MSRTRPGKVHRQFGDGLVVQNDQLRIFLHPERSFYLNEIVRHANAGKGAVQRELLKLESSGLILATTIGNQKHATKINRAFIFGSIAKATDRAQSDFDNLLKIGQIKLDTAQKIGTPFFSY
ncbi:MAG TPA: hypothetical protein VFV43_03870 [Limnobacter sp.]|nr:hypothetical protein [Limnobacter sp.]